MKTIVAIAAIALTSTAPAFAESAAELFAASENSAAERIVSATSVGDISGAQLKFAQNESAAEMNLHFGADNNVTRSASAQSFFALSNDSAAERIVN